MHDKYLSQLTQNVIALRKKSFFYLEVGLKLFVLLRGVVDIDGGGDLSLKLLLLPLPSMQLGLGGLQVLGEVAALPFDGVALRGELPDGRLGGIHLRLHRAQSRVHRLPADRLGAGGLLQTSSMGLRLRVGTNNKCNISHCSITVNDKAHI